MYYIITEHKNLFLRAMSQILMNYWEKWLNLLLVVELSNSPQAMHGEAQSGLQS